MRPVALLPVFFMFKPPIKDRIAIKAWIVRLSIGIFVKLVVIFVKF